MTKVTIAATYLAALFVPYGLYSLDIPQDPKTKLETTRERLTRLSVETKEDRMQRIEFIPDAFNEVTLGYEETHASACTPRLPQGAPRSKILISTPESIVCHLDAKYFTPIIPVCAICQMSYKRTLKYDHLGAKMLHVKKIEEDTVYSGKIVRIFPWGPGHIAPKPGYAEADRERMAEVETAQQFSEEELEIDDDPSQWDWDNMTEARPRENFFYKDYINVNLMEYVDMPFLPGKYEVFLSVYGLESNHTIVEIVME